MLPLALLPLASALSSATAGVVAKQALIAGGTAAAFAIPGMLERRATAQEANASNLDQQLHISRMLDQLRRQRDGTSQLAGLAAAFQQREYNQNDRLIGEANADNTIAQIMRRHQERIGASSIRSQPSTAEQYMMRLLSRR